jgi:hypothetical protein
MITMEPLRYCSYRTLLNDFEPGLIDPEFLEAMARIPADAEESEKKEFPDACRRTMYRFVLDEVAKVSPRTPVAFCREKRSTWNYFADDLKRMGQDPDNYVCNCGPASAGCDRRPEKALA